MDIAMNLKNMSYNALVLVGKALVADLEFQVEPSQDGYHALRTHKMIVNRQLIEVILELEGRNFDANEFREANARYMDSIGYKLGEGHHNYV